MFLKFDDRIVNTDHIIQVYRAPTGNLAIFLSNDKDPVKLEGDKAKKVWEALKQLSDDVLEGSGPRSIKPL